MKSVITRLEADRDRAGVGEIPYVLEVRGERVQGVDVKRVQDRETGSLTVHIKAARLNGKPVLPMATQDAVARQILSGARVQVYGRNAGVQVRIYGR